MSLVATRVLVINPQLAPAVAIKRTLEQVGGFEVASFTSAGAALDHLGLHPYDVAIADLVQADMPGPDLVFRLRAAQPEVAIIATPRSAEVAAIVNDLDLQGMIDLPCPARELVPILKQAVAHMRDTLPDTAQAPPLGGDSETLVISEAQAESPAPSPVEVPEFASLDRDVMDMGGLEATPDELDKTPDQGAKPARSDEQHRRSPVELVLGGQPPAPPEVDDTPAGDSQMRIFRQLASEEPEVPTLEESGTISDLMLGVSDSNLKQVVSILRGDDAPEPKETDPRSEYVERLKASAAVLDDEPTDKIPALVILETAADESTPLQAFSLDEFLVSIEQQLPPGQHDIRPLPSWVQESARYVQEPDFLPEDLSELEQSTDLSIQTTRASRMQRLEEHPEQLETDRLHGTRRSRPAPPDTLPEPAVDEADTARDEVISGEQDAPAPADVEPVPAPPHLEPSSPAELEGVTATMPLHEVEALQADFGRLSESPEPEAPQPTAKAPPKPSEPPAPEDPYIAQLALSLTQVSLELTAEATLLAHEGKIVAYAGNLPEEDIEDLRAAVADDWAANPEEARIRFITLPSSGKDYMVYSRRTVGGFTLSMIFAGSMPLRVIRRQSDRLAEALSTVPEIVLVEAEPPSELAEPAQVSAEETVAEVLPIPEPAPEKPAAPLVEVGPVTALTYVWLLRDADHPITNELAQAIVTGLEPYMSSMAWSVKTFRIHEDYIYLLVDAPAEPAPHEVIHELMRRSAEIVRSRDRLIDLETLWDDSYLVVTPGRDLDIEEIQRFINFARDR